MNPKTISYGVASFSLLPKIINSNIDSGDPFCIHVNGQEVPDDVNETYFKLMERLNIGVLFYPYCEFIPGVNRVFGLPNPLIEVRLKNGSFLNAVRQVNCGAMFFNPVNLVGMKFDENLKFAFFDKFIDNLASVGGIPSNGILFDVHESWKLFPRYKRMPFGYTRQYSEEMVKENIVLDTNTSKFVKWINGLKTVDGKQLNTETP